MNIFSKVFGFVNGYKTYIAGASFLLIGLGTLLIAVGHCIEDVSTIINGWDVCQMEVSAAWNGVYSALAGLGLIGVKHAIEKQG